MAANKQQQEQEAASTLATKPSAAAATAAPTLALPRAASIAAPAAGCSKPAAGFRPTRQPLFIPPLRAPHTSTLIFLHGLGDSGAGWAFLAKDLAADLPTTAFVFAHAPEVSRPLGYSLPKQLRLLGKPSKLGQCIW